MNKPDLNVSAQTMILIASNMQRKGIHYSCGNTKCKKHEPENKLLFCSRCKCVKYCSGICQRQSWSIHKSLCSEIESIKRKSEEHIKSTSLYYCDGYLNVNHRTLDDYVFHIWLISTCPWNYQSKSDKGVRTKDGNFHTWLEIEDLVLTYTFTRTEDRNKKIEIAARNSMMERNSRLPPHLRLGIP